MKADSLLNWDKVELANILAEELADAEDLIEALPSLEKAGVLEESVLDDYIQRNWQLILSCFDEEELIEWVEEKEYEEEWERWRDECVEQDHEYEEYKLEEYCWSIIEIALSFRVMDLAEQWGHPPKWRKS